MGVYQTTLFDVYGSNASIVPEGFSDGEDIFYGYLLENEGLSRTDSLSGTTDSAAGGTALSCGIKTENGNIGRDKDLNDVKSLTELAYEKGMAAAVMSTETKTGATPASFSAHADSRNSSTDIIKSQAATRDKFGTIIDCGFDYYTERYIEVIERHISDTLSKVSANEKGFFLMYEEAHTDKHSHSNNIEKLMNAMVRFNQAIGRFMEFCFYNPDTMLLITADHETGDLYPEENGQLKFHHDDHTSKDVLIFGYGQGAELFHGQNVENIQIAHTIASFMGEENFGDQSVYGSLTK
jgi:alkaline phosphatase